MPKPFGKPVRRGLQLTKSLRFAIALAGAALPAYFLCLGPSSACPTLSASPFFWPSFVAFWVFYSFSLARWMRRRPSPRGPWESSRAGTLLMRLLIGAIATLPVAFLSAWLYEPALKTANALVRGGDPDLQYALVVRKPGLVGLESPYWEPSFSLRLDAVPTDVPAGSLAKLSVRSGLLGARWVEKIEYEALR